MSSSMYRDVGVLMQINPAFAGYEQPLNTPRGIRCMVALRIAAHHEARKMSATQDADRYIDMKSAEDFASHLSRIIDYGALGLMISIGHRTRLFDLMAGIPAATSSEIAHRANLSERYVREWLAALVVGGVITYDATARTYRLPPEHSASLSRHGALPNIAVYAQNISLLGGLEELILARFQDGKGTSYADYPRFHEVMAEDSAQTVVRRLFDVLLPLAEGLTQRLKTGIDVLDAGCGRGRALLAMAQRFPDSRFTGYDFCADAITDARCDASTAGLSNVAFEVRDLTHLHESRRYDLVCSFDAIHDQKDPRDYLRRLCESLRAGGVYLVQDIGGSAHLENNLDFPMAALLYTVSCMHCMPVSLGQDGEGLGTMWGWETAEAMLSHAGFDVVERHILPHDPMNIWFVCCRRH